jgi:CubicO group peptidase (beta-lactamase class C family)
MSVAQVVPRDVRVPAVPYVTAVEESFRWHPNLSRIANPSRPLFPRLELLITEEMDEWKIPGLAVAVVQSGEVALVKAYGLRDVEAGLQATTDTSVPDRPRNHHFGYARVWLSPSNLAV